MKYFIFDMDDTLYLRAEPFVRACTQKFPESTAWDPQKLYLIRKKHSDFSYDAYGAGRMSKEDMYAYRTIETFREYEITLNREEALAFEDLYAQMQGQIFFQKGMEDCLQFLQEKGMPMYIISNGPSERQRRKLKALGMYRFIPETHWLVSGDIGIDKPDPRIFQYAAKTFGIPAEKAWYIGDSFEADIVGAFRSGWHSIWLNHRKETAAERLAAAGIQDAESAAADHMVSSCAELLHLLQDIAIFH